MDLKPFYGKGPHPLLWTASRSARRRITVSGIRNCLNFRVIFITYIQFTGGTRWRSLLRHRDTSRKVAGSIPDGVVGIFHLHNPSGRTVALGSTQPLTEMSTRNISLGVKAAGA